VIGNVKHKLLECVSAGSALLITRLKRDFDGVVPDSHSGMRAMRDAQLELSISDEAAAAQLGAANAAATEKLLEACVAASKVRGASANPESVVEKVDELLRKRRTLAATYAAAEQELAQAPGAPVSASGIPALCSRPLRDHFFLSSGVGNKNSYERIDIFCYNAETDRYYKCFNDA
jgi:hypothetical protein